MWDAPKLMQGAFTTTQVTSPTSRLFSYIVQVVVMVPLMSSAAAVPVFSSSPQTTVVMTVNVLRTFIASPPFTRPNAFRFGRARSTSCYTRKNTRLWKFSRGRPYSFPSIAGPGCRAALTVQPQIVIRGFDIQQAPFLVPQPIPVLL